MDDAKVDAYRATATSAVREASNGATLVERARREAGIELEVIEGVEEARLIQLAVVRRLGLSDTRALLVDVGGGSTELTCLDDGAARVLDVAPDRHGAPARDATPRGGDEPVDRDAQKLPLRASVDRALAEALPHLAKTPFELVVGTGGSVDTLSELCPLKGGHAGYPRAVDVGAMRALLGKLFGMSAAEQRRDAFGLRPDRADTIVTGRVDLLRVAEMFKATRDRRARRRPQGGHPRGARRQVLRPSGTRSPRRAAVVDACCASASATASTRRTASSSRRSRRRSSTTWRELHGFGERDRLLLRAAALLHDIGDYVRYDGHHKHSYYLIQHSDIMGLTPDERGDRREHRALSPQEPARSVAPELPRSRQGRARARCAASPPSCASPTRSIASTSAR